MVVGESGSGKSTNVKVLAKALTTLFEDKVVDKDGFYKQVDCLILNPKSITAGELYGEFNLMTNEWKVKTLTSYFLISISNSQILFYIIYSLLSVFYQWVKGKYMSVLYFNLLSFILNFFIFVFCSLI